MVSSFFSAKIGENQKNKNKQVFAVKVMDFWSKIKKQGLHHKSVELWFYIMIWCHTRLAAPFQLRHCWPPHQASLHGSSCVGKKKQSPHNYFFPPKCSHKMQPLNVAVYGLFQRFFASICDAWLTLHPRSTISSYLLKKSQKGLRERIYCEKHCSWM